MQQNIYINSKTEYGTFVEVTHETRISLFISHVLFNCHWQKLKDTALIEKHDGKGLLMAAMPSEQMQM